MSIWTIILLYMLGAILGAIIIEKTYKNRADSEGPCTCVSWGSSAHPSGVRTIRDANCPIHTEG